MRRIPASKKFTIAEHSTYPNGFHCPNPRGWYHSVANVADTPEGLVAVYRLSDSHTAVYTHIMVAYSKDGGRTWEGPIAQSPIGTSGSTTASGLPRR